MYPSTFPARRVTGYGTPYSTRTGDRATGDASVVDGAHERDERGQERMPVYVAVLRACTAWSATDLTVAAGETDGGTVLLLVDEEEELAQRLLVHAQRLVVADRHDGRPPADEVAAEDAVVARVPAEGYGSARITVAHHMHMWSGVRPGV